MTKFSQWLVIFFFCGVCYSCSTNVVYSETVAFNDEQWDVIESASFEFPVTDTIERHKLNFLLRHTSAYPYSNLFLLIQTTMPDGLNIVDTVEYLLANAYGEWIGNKGSNLWSCDLQYRKEIIFPVSGTYQISVTHGMRTNKLQGIRDISLVLYKEEEGNGEE